ncbi:hypothetical protein Trydic_g4526 [Trypoxylus dichotomus]
MKSQIYFALYFQIYLCLAFAEWVEISKSPTKEVNGSIITFKTSSIPDDGIAARENEDEEEGNNKQTFVNKVFVKEQIMEDDLNKEVENDIENKGTNYLGFIPFIENVQSSLLKNAHQGTKSKISLLQQLKYNLLFNIKENINKLWRPGSARSAREYYDKDDEGHIDFPSNEGALMTIGFLTFAVFLIKLVLEYSLRGEGHYFAGKVGPSTAKDMEECGVPPSHQRNVGRSW